MTTLMDSLFGHIALISPQYLSRFMGKFAGIDIPDQLLHRLDMQPDDEEDFSVDIFGEKIPAPQIYENGLAVVPVKGVITSGLPRIFKIMGMVDTAQVTGWITDIAANKDVTQIILDIDSPGGMYMGTPELADAVNNAAAAKPVIAHTSGMMDSAAYWIASQATAIYCTPSADVGCIGVYELHVSMARMLQNQGIDVNLFKSGDLKATGHPAVEMSEAQKANVQAGIDAIGAQFRATVKSKRIHVSDDSMRGQSFIGTEAVARNLSAGLRSFQSLL